MKCKIFYLIVLSGLLVSCASRKNDPTTFISPYSAVPPPVGQSALVYGLPQTRLFFEVELVRTVIKRGPYAEYANRMLGLVNVPTSDTDTWQIKSVQISDRREVDNSKLFAVSFTDYPQNIDRLLRFTREGLLMDLNIGNVLVNNRDLGKYTDDFQLVNMLVRNTSVERVDTLYQTVDLDTAFVHIPVLQRRVISRTTEELARDAADQIFDIRKWRTDILRGDVDYPADGEALMVLLNTFDRKEEHLLSLFIGAKSETRQVITYSALPDTSGTPVELFYFSERSGIVNRGASGARAVWYTINGATAPVSVVHSQQAKNIIYYRIPQIVEVTAGIDRNILVSEQVAIYQFGNIVSFPLISQ